MAETVGQHTIAAITAPVNGQPQDANVVRGNDNTIRVGHNSHDDDPGIHLQSSTYAARPAAGSAGRKWVTQEDGRFELWYDDGSRWQNVSSGLVLVDALADSTLTAGKIVKLTGFDSGQSLPRIDVTSAATDVAFGMVLRNVSSGGVASIVTAGLVAPISTVGYSLGAALYHAGSGNMTSTQPASGPYQVCAVVLEANDGSGTVYVTFPQPQTVEAVSATANTLVKRDGSGNIAAAIVNATSVTATNLSGALAAANVQPGTFPNGTFTAQNVTVTGTLTAATIAAVAASAVTAGTFGAGNYTFPGTLTVTSDLTVDTNTLRVTASNNRVGVNVTTPLSPLHVVGTTRVDGAMDISNDAAGSVKFPASPTGSADANTLDAYAETAWTPAKESGIADTTVTDNGSYFIKVGRLVHVYAYFDVSSTNVPDSMIIEGLPASAYGTGELRMYVVSGNSNITYPTTDTNAWARGVVRVTSNGKMTFQYYTSSGGLGGAVWIQADTKTFVVTGTYRANS